MRKWRVLSAVLALAVTGLAQMEAKPKLAFDVVSIKPNHSGEAVGLLSIEPGGDRLAVTNSPMYRIVGFAFGFQRSDLVIGAPDWTRTERWDIEAKVAPEDLPAFRALTFAQQREMLKGVLAERCHLAAHAALKEVPVYALEFAKGGLAMHEVPPSEALTDKKGGWGDLVNKRGEIRGRDVPMAALLYALSDAGLGRQVVDRTGLDGNYNFDLLWTPDDEPNGTTQSIFTAIQDQLGLRLVATRATVKALMIEHIERPTAD